MTAVFLKTDKPGIFKCEFSDGSSLLMAVNYLPTGEFPSVWESGRELSVKDEEDCRFASLCLRAEKIALRLIARAEQHSRGLTAKLERRGFKADVASAVVHNFQNRNMLDDRRYAERWIRSRLNLKKAPTPRWLYSSLGKRGIDRAEVKAAMGAVLDPETEFFLLQKYQERNKSPDSDKSGYIKFFLKNEGFSSTAIERFLDEE